MVRTLFFCINILHNLSVLEVRPEFTGTVAIKSGRHPILETFHPAGTLVSNDVYCDDSSSFQIIQGPKYTYYSMRWNLVGVIDFFAFFSMSGTGCEYLSFQYLRLKTFLFFRKKYISKADRPFNGHGHVWMFCSCGICQFSVRVQLKTLFLRSFDSF